MIGVTNIAVLSMATAIAASGSGCSSQSCSGLGHSYNVTVERDVAASVAVVSKADFRFCVVAVCNGLKPDGLLIEGVGNVNLTPGANGGTHVQANVLVKEPSHAGEPPWPASTVSVRGIDGKGVVVLDVVGDVNWDGDQCHPQPTNRTL